MTVSIAIYMMKVSHCNESIYFITVIREGRRVCRERENGKRGRKECPTQINLISFASLLLLQCSPYLRATSNLRPIWLTNLMCDSSDDQLSQCVRTSNVIGYADCTDFAIAAVDCGEQRACLNQRCTHTINCTTHE